MRKYIKNILMLFIILNIIILPSTNTYASVFGDVFSQGEDFIAIGTESTISEEDLRTPTSNMFNMLFIIGIGLSVIVGGILGIQFMLASAEDKAKIKESLIPYVIGCAVIFGSFTIWRVVILILNNL